MSEDLGIEVKAGTVIVKTTEGKILTPRLGPVPTRLLAKLIDVFPDPVDRRRLEHIAYADDLDTPRSMANLRVHLKKVRNVVDMHGALVLKGVQRTGWRLVRVPERLQNDPS